MFLFSGGLFIDRERSSADTLAGTRVRQAAHFVPVTVDVVEVTRSAKRDEGSERVDVRSAVVGNIGDGSASLRRADLGRRRSQSCDRREKLPAEVACWAVSFQRTTVSRNMN